MRNFIFIFVLLTVVVLIDSKNVVKRHSSLVSRFTSNPFFLSHFSGGSGSFGFQAARRFHHFAEPEKYDYEDESEEEEDEEEDVIPKVTYIFRPKVNNVEPTKQEEEKNSDEQKVDEDRILYIFKSLPHFERPEVFKEKIHRPVEKVEEQEVQIEQKQPVSYVFRSLPYYERPVLFHEKILRPVETVQEQEVQLEEKQPVLYVFRSLPYYERPVLFREKILRPVEKVEKQEVKEEENQPILYVFRSLPYYERPVLFREVVPQPIKKPDASTFVYNNLPHFQIREKFDKPVVNPQVAPKTLSFVPVPQPIKHFESGDKFQIFPSFVTASLGSQATNHFESQKDNGETLTNSIQKATSQPLNYFENQKTNRDKIVEFKTAPSSVSFTPRPINHFEKQKVNSDKVVEIKTLPNPVPVAINHIENQGKNEDKVEVKTPGSATVNFHSAQYPRKKLVKVIRRKKILETPEDVYRFSKHEFGKKLFPGGKTNLENFGLGHILFDSYGNFVEESS